MFTLSFSLNPESKTKLYQQLYTNLAHGIDSGDIPKGTKIFSVRDMARELNVSKNTVTKAYSELIQSGYLVSKNKSGFYVSKPVKKSVTKTESVSLHMEEKTIEQELIESFKFALTLNAHLLKNSGDPFGDAALRNSIAVFIKSFRGFSVNSSHMVLSAGVSLLLNNVLFLPSLKHPSGGHGLLAVATSFNDEDKHPGVMMMEGADENFKRIIKLCGYDCVYIKQNESGIDIEDLMSHKEKILLVSSNDVILKKEADIKDNRRDILRWASCDTGRYIIEYDCTNSDADRKAFKCEDTDDRVIYMGSISNLLFKALNASWVVLPEKLTMEYRKMFVDYECALSRLDQLALTDFINGGNLSRYLESIEVLE